MLMLNKTNSEQVQQHYDAYQKACEDTKVLRARIQTLENEVAVLRRECARKVNAMEDYLSLTETLDFKVPTARLRFLMDFEFIYLRFDRNGEIKHAYSPEKYNDVIKGEWEEINNRAKQA
jgi:hypothetical protein